MSAPRSDATPRWARRPASLVASIRQSEYLTVGRSPRFRAVQRIRAEDAVYRFGGEEFLVLLRLNTLEDLATAGERIRRAVVDARIAHPANGRANVVTISLGGVLLTPADLTQSDDEWFAKADAALYRAKANGRDRVELAAAVG